MAKQQDNSQWTQSELTRTLRKEEITTHLLNFRIEVDKFILNLPSHSNGVSFTSAIMAALEFSTLLEQLRGEYIEACFAVGVSHIRRDETDPSVWNELKKEGKKRFTSANERDELSGLFAHNATIAVDSQDVLRNKTKSYKADSEPVRTGHRFETIYFDDMGGFSPIRPNRSIDDHLRSEIQNRSPPSTVNHSTPNVSPSLIKRRPRFQKK